MKDIPDITKETGNLKKDLTLFFSHEIKDPFKNYLIARSMDPLSDDDARFLSIVLTKTRSLYEIRHGLADEYPATHNAYQKFRDLLIQIGSYSCLSPITKDNYLMYKWDLLKKSTRKDLDLKIANFIKKESSFFLEELSLLPDPYKEVFDDYIKGRSLTNDEYKLLKDAVHLFGCITTFNPIKITLKDPYALREDLVNDYIVSIDTDNNIKKKISEENQRILQLNGLTIYIKDKYTLNVFLNFFKSGQLKIQALYATT